MVIIRGGGITQQHIDILGDVIVLTLFGLCFPVEEHDHRLLAITKS